MPYARHMHWRELPPGATTDQTGQIGQKLEFASAWTDKHGTVIYERAFATQAVYFPLECDIDCRNETRTEPVPF